jgi:hypothetical protein
MDWDLDGLGRHTVLWHHTGAEARDSHSVGWPGYCGCLSGNAQGASQRRSIWRFRYRRPLSKDCPHRICCVGSSRTVQTVSAKKDAVYRSTSQPNASSQRGVLNWSLSHLGAFRHGRYKNLKLTAGSVPEHCTISVAPTLSSSGDRFFAQLRCLCRLLSVYLAPPSMRRRPVLFHRPGPCGREPKGCVSAHTTALCFPYWRSLCYVADDPGKRF